jgi:hypothetical protein
VLLGEPPPLPPFEPPLWFPPPPGEDGGVELVGGVLGTVPVLEAHGFVPPELGATLGLAEDVGDPLVDGAGVEDDVAPPTVQRTAGMENGSRPFTCFTPVVADGDGVGLPDGAVVGNPPPVGGPIVVGCPPPPLSRVKARMTTSTAATPPRIRTSRRSRSESCIRPRAGRC